MFISTADSTITVSTLKQTNCASSTSVQRYLIELLMLPNMLTQLLLSPSLVSGHSISRQLSRLSLTP